jgi:predicted Fe-Mo cluster-binding NifX family protein
MVTIAIPVTSQNGIKSELSEHFNKTTSFAVLTSEGEKIDGLHFIDNRLHDAKEPKSNAAYLVESGVDVLLTGSIGPHMIAELLNGGTRVFKGGIGNVEHVIKDYAAGRLTEIDTAGEVSHHHHH